MGSGSEKRKKVPQHSPARIINRSNGKRSGLLNTRLPRVRKRLGTLDHTGIGHRPHSRALPTRNASGDGGRSLVRAKGGRGLQCLEGACVPARQRSCLHGGLWSHAPRNSKGLIKKTLQLTRVGTILKALLIFNLSAPGDSVDGIVWYQNHNKHEAESKRKKVQS